MTKTENVNGSNSIAEASNAPRAGIAWWVQVAVVGGAVLTAMGAFIALVHPSMLVSIQDPINGAVRTYACYFAARNLALACLLLLLLALRATRALNNLMVLMGFIQFLDASMDCAEGRWAIVPGVLVLGLVFMISAAKLCGHPFWRREAWIGPQA
jgi:hypothetical protein